MVRKFKILMALTSVLSLSSLQAQDDDFDLLGDEKPVVTKVNYAFKTTKVINLQSTEVTDKGVLDFKMMLMKPSVWINLLLDLVLNTESLTLP